MAKGDKKKVENQLQTQTNLVQPGAQNLQRQTGGRTSGFQDLFNTSVGQQTGDYNDIMGGYKGFRSNLPNATGYLDKFLKSGITGENGGALAPATSAFSSLSSSGGFSPGDIANIRAQAMAPVHGVGDMLRRNIERQNAVRGMGGSPNTTAALAKSARDTAYAAGDTGVNAEAEIAKLMQGGKIAGAQGLASTLLGGRGQDLDAISKTLGLDLSGLEGMRSLYGTTPGMADMFGKQVLASSGQEIDSQQAMNQIMQMVMSGQISAAEIPSTFQNIMQNIKTGAGIVGAVAKGGL